MAGITSKIILINHIFIRQFIAIGNICIRINLVTVIYKIDMTLFPPDSFICLQIFI